MRISFVISLLLLFTFGYNPIYAQTSFDKIDARSKSVPDSLVTYQNITHYLTKDLTTDTEKLRAIYVWVTHNIRYDFMDETPANNSNLVVKKRSGVCRHYSQLFDDMCKSAGIKSYIISGYTKSFKNEIAKQSHAWNLVCINDSFIFVDATWGSGFASGENVFIKEYDAYYFMQSPDLFIKRHMPFDPIWQCLSNPISNYDFLKQNRFMPLKKGSYNFKDSIALFEQQDTITRLEKCNDRIIKQGITNDLISEEIIINENNLSVFKENARVVKYNEAVSYYNSANNAMRAYFIYKSRRFLKQNVPLSPPLADSSIRKLIAIPLSSLKKVWAIIDTEQLKKYSSAISLKPNLVERLTIAEKEFLFVEKYLNRSHFSRYFMMF